MHQHPCRHCKKEFVCGESAFECFRTEITCDSCYWTHDFAVFLLVLVLAAAAVGLTYLLFWLVRG